MLAKDERNVGTPYRLFITKPYIVVMGHMTRPRINPHLLLNAVPTLVVCLRNCRWPSTVDS